MRQALLTTLAVPLALLGTAGPCRAADEPPEIAAPPSHRFAVTPSWTHAFVPRSVSADAIGLTVQATFDARGRFGLGLTGALYSPFPLARAAVPASSPASETLGSLIPEFTYTPLRGPRAELTVLAGVGVLASRPVSLVDPGHRTFSYDTNLAMSYGAALRVYLTRQMAVSLEGRNVVYVQAQESAQVDQRAPGDPSTWYGDRRLVPAVETRLGLTVFLSAREP